MALEVVLDTFTGPLDLLLHLIQTQEINIHDIPIATITDQYLAYLHTMEELSLEIASEFLVMAATLLAIKSRMLLPRPTRTDEPEEEAEDPRAELVRQLLEYQRCKWAAEQLKERHLLQSQVYARPPLDLGPFAPQEPPPLTGVSLWQLVDAYRRLVQRIPKERRVATIEGTVISVEEEMERLLDKLRLYKEVTFLQLFGGVPSRRYLVAAFLALLELVKAGAVRCWQPEPLGDIVVVLQEGDER
ncbi:segregation and condensation protein A [Alicyclobacillus macrosporangiidus]|uniref:Segregation and condensation protein A n=1 Tax=Alicyclobacillus macrosporangiidus TaxID=392015 RepID=A0A1I7KM79_9BACL|nr:segregation/condensation protein A [Alicyclobacillus macrosporangiidus]SFU98532.1 condensin subunit ScpA [Alicyclobacillus macrosporangiidus]